MNLQEAKNFVAHFVTGDYTPEEYASFLGWLRGASLDELNAIADEHEALHESWSLPVGAPSPEWVAMLEGKLDRVVEHPAESPEVLVANVFSGDVLSSGGTPVRRIGADRFTRRRTWITAASVIVLLSGGTILYLQQHNENRESKINGQNAFSSKGFTQSTINPRGSGEKQLVLADGSKVWLNAASTLRYPASFGSRERVVELSGEAFFEVAQNSATPFRVLIKDAEVEVLGTHFNINAFEDEPVSKTTLIDGAVKMQSGSHEIILHPGQQVAIAYASGASSSQEGGNPVVTTVDASAVLGWRNGNLEFTNADLPTVMRAVQRYYNVEVQYASNLPEKTISCGFRRQDGLVHVLKLLESLFDLRFINNDGKTVTVTR